MTPCKQRPCSNLPTKQYGRRKWTNGSECTLHSGTVNVDTQKMCDTCIIHTIEVQKSEHLVDPKVLCYTFTQAACNWLFEHVSYFRELAKKIEGDNAIMLGQ